MLRFKNVLMLAAVAVTLIAASAIGGVRPASGGSAGGNAIAVYVFDEDDARNAEALADSLLGRLIADRRYSAPTGRGQRQFFAAVDAAQRRADRRPGSGLLEDRDFCRIGGDNGVQFLAIVEVEKRGRGANIFARIIDLDRCREISTSEFSGLIRNTAEVRAAAAALSAELLDTRVRRSRGAAPAPAPAPAPAGGTAMAVYVFDEDDARNAEVLADTLLARLIANRRYTAPSGRGQRQFFQAVDAAQRRADRRPGSGLLEDRDFCRIGGDNGVQFLTIVDVEKRGRGASVYARILDLDRCRVISSSEFTGLIRNTAEVRAAADALSRELLDTRIRTRSAR